MPTITIHPELQSLIPPLSPEERAQLEANLRTEGCRDPLVVWQETQTLLDGHNRFEICESHGISYAVHEIALPDLDSAKAWVITNQLGRRNLTPEQMSYLRGAQYHLHKKESRGGGDHRRGDATDQKVQSEPFDLFAREDPATKLATDQKVQSEPFDDTATRLAKDHKVSRSTIKRDGAYAEAIDTVAEVLGPEARQTILARETKLTRDGVAQLADLAREDSDTALAALTDIQAARAVTKAREALERHVGGQQQGGGSPTPSPALAHGVLFPEVVADPGERQRTEAEAHARRRLQEIADAVEHLQTLERDHGRDTVTTEVIEPFLGHSVAASPQAPPAPAVPPAPGAWIPLTAEEALLTAAMDRAADGIEVDDAAALLDETRLLAGKRLARLIDLRVARKEGRRYVRRQEVPA